jgi:hypothetical protein
METILGIPKSLLAVFRFFFSHRFLVSRYNAILVSLVILFLIFVSVRTAINFYTKDNIVEADAVTQNSIFIKGLNEGLFTNDNSLIYTNLSKNEPLLPIVIAFENRHEVPCSVKSIDKKSKKITHAVKKYKKIYKKNHYVKKLSKKPNKYLAQKTKYKKAIKITGKSCFKEKSKTNCWKTTNFLNNS